MNTFEFFNRLLSPLKANSLESLGANEGLELVSALNAALQKFYAAAPDRFRRKDGQSLEYRAPLAMVGNFTNGSNAVTGAYAIDGVPNAMVVDEAGFLGVRGLYLYDGLLEERPSYLKYQDTEKLRWTNAGSMWDLGGAAYQGPEDVPTPDLVLNWITIAPSPPPTVRRATWAEIIAAGLNPEDYGGTVIRLGLDLSLRGSSVLIEGTWNRINGENTLQHTYLGETGTKTFTLYGDAISLSGISVDRLLSDPVKADGYDLMHPDPMHEYLFDYESRDFNEQRNRSIGEPRYYKMTHVGDSSNSVEPQGILLISPVPSVAGHLTVDLLHRPQRYKLNNLLRDSEILPLADDLIERILLPIAVGELVDSELWRNEKAINRAERRAYEAESRAADLEPFVGIPSHSVGTTQGY